MSDDIVKRLAGLKRMLALAFGECNEQATIADGINSIERLRAELAAAVEHVRNTDEACNRYAAERKRMKAKLRAVCAEFAEQITGYGDERLSAVARAEAAEAERDALRAQLDEACEALKPLADAKFMFGSIETYSVSGRDVRYARMTLDSVLDKIKGGGDE